MHEFKRELKKLDRESGGLLQVEVIRPQDIAPMTIAALDGNYHAAMRVLASFESAAKIKSLARKKPVICLCCPRAVRNPHATLALICAASDCATVAVASAVCERCSVGDLADLLPRVAKAYQGFFPDLRPVGITHPVGGNA